MANQKPKSSSPVGARPEQPDRGEAPSPASSRPAETGADSVVKLASVGGGEGFDSYVAPREDDSALDPASEMMAFFQSRRLRG